MGTTVYEIIIMFVLRSKISNRAHDVIRKVFAEIADQWIYGLFNCRTNQSHLVGHCRGSRFKALALCLHVSDPNTVSITYIPSVASTSNHRLFERYLVLRNYYKMVAFTPNATNNTNTIKFSSLILISFGKS